MNIIFIITDIETNGIQTYKYPNPSPLSPKDKINGPINETFVLNCPKCASHFKSSPLLEQHLKKEHNICDYAGVNTEHLHNGGTESGMEMIVEEGIQENEEEGTLIMSGEQDDTNQFGFGRNVNTSLIAVGIFCHYT